MRAARITVDNYLAYLSEKYHKTFALASQESAAWCSVYSTALFKDEEDNFFQVRHSKDGFCDSYNAIIFDKEIQNRFENAIRQKCKVYVNTSSYFSYVDGIFPSCDAYLSQQPVLTVKVYLQEDGIQDEISSQMIGVVPESMILSVLYIVDEETFQNLENSEQTPKRDDSIKSYSFMIVNDIVNTKSWEK